MEQDSASNLRGNLLALPRWAAWGVLGLLTFGVSLGFALLLLPDLGEGAHSAGGQLLALSLPTLAVTMGVLGASWAHTARIDELVARYVRVTVGDKFEAYLIGSAVPEDGAPYPPVFARMERHYRSDVTSFCRYHLFDHDERRFDIEVKSNVFNFEVTYCIELATPPTGFTPDMAERSYDVGELDTWTETTRDPLLALVPATIHGTLSEGYTVYVEAISLPDGGLHVTYRMRQRPQSNFLTSPYLRRYFSEDAAIAAFFFYQEALAHGGEAIRGGRL